MKYMKVLVIFAAVFIAAFLVVQKNKTMAAEQSFIPNCLGISGKFYANKTWKGGYIMVGCAGDDGGAVNQNPNRWCKGQVQKVYPGKPFRLTKCSCFGKEGCLKIGKELSLSTTLNANRKYAISVVKRIDEMPQFKNNGCRINKIGQMCGTNTMIIKPRIKITCDVPTGTPTRTKTPTPTGGVCPVPDKVQNVKVTCPSCSTSSSNSNSTTTTTTLTTTDNVSPSPEVTPTITVAPSEALTSTPTPTVEPTN